MEKTVDELKQEKVKQLSRCEIVLSQLTNNPAWQIVIEDFTKQKQMIDDNWHLVADDNRLKELRVTKMAIQALITAVQNYAADKDRLTREIHELNNPDTVVPLDYDSQ